LSDAGSGAKLSVFAFARVVGAGGCEVQPPRTTDIERSGTGHQVHTRVPRRRVE
jgi:hypothetical protein